MRVAVMLALVFLSSCASEKLALAPPSGVDFSGHWRLNEPESDDPLRLVQGQSNSSKVNSQGQDGRRRGRGRPGDPGGAGGPAGASAGGPEMPGVGAMDEGLRWPGKELDIKQTAGVVTLTSAGLQRIYQPRKSNAERRPSGSRAPNRDLPDRDRGDGPAAICGWDDKTLVVQGGESEDERPVLEQRYSLSEDGQRLIEVVGFTSGRSRGFTMSRTWDRADLPKAPSAAAGL